MEVAVLRSFSRNVCRLLMQTAASNYDFLFVVDEQNIKIKIR